MSPQKALFKILKCKKHGETLDFFFLLAFNLSIVDSLAIVPLKSIDPFALYH
jgi:hypothetical protein